MTAASLHFCLSRPSPYNGTVSYRGYTGSTTVLLLWLSSRTTGQSCVCVCFNLIYMLYNVSECLHLSRKFTSSEKTRITSLMVSILLKGANTVNWKMLKEIRKSINKIHATKSKNQNFTMHLFLIYFNHTNNHYQVLNLCFPYFSMCFKDEFISLNR